MTDWQSYLDGSMPSAERDRLEQLLQTNAAAQAELAGYKSFLEAINHQGQAETVPYARLHSAFDNVIGPVQSGPRYAFLRPALAMALVLTVFAFGMRAVNDPHALARMPIQGHIRAISPEQVAAWASKKIGLPAPLVPLQGTGAELLGASHGSNWASYEYRVGSDKVTLYFANRKANGLQKNKLGQISRNGVAWQGKKLAFFLSGPRSALLKVMHKAMEESRVPYEPDPSACRIVE